MSANGRTAMAEMSCVAACKSATPPGAAAATRATKRYPRRCRVSMNLGCFVKRMLTRVIPPAAERSTYVLASSLALLLVFWQWRPLGGIVWDVRHEAGRALLLGGFAFGW